MGPVEVIVVGFPGSQFNGEILPALQDLVSAGTISVVDGMLLTKDADGAVSFTEFEETHPAPEVAALAALVQQSVDLVSAEDVDELSANLAPGDSAAVLVFEHTWAIPFQAAVVGSGGFLLNDFLVPGPVVDEVLAAVAELD